VVMLLIKSSVIAALVVVVVVVVVAKGPKIPKAFLIRSGAQRNFAYVFTIDRGSACNSCNS